MSSKNPNASAEKFNEGVSETNFKNSSLQHCHYKFIGGGGGGMFNTPLYFNVLNIIIINIKYGLDTCQRKSENFTSFNEVWKSLFYLLARAKYFASTEIIFNNMLKCEILLKLILTFLLCNLFIDFNLNWLGKVSFQASNITTNTTNMQAIIYLVKVTNNHQNNEFA